MTVMDDSRVLRGTELRYALTMYVAQHGPCDIATLIAGLGDQGFVIGGYPPKAVSDALRWERGHYRVIKRGRGKYDYWDMPRSTEYRIHKRVLALRAQASRIRCEADTSNDTPDSAM